MWTGLISCEVGAASFNWPEADFTEAKLIADQRREIRVIPHFAIHRCGRTLTATFGGNL